MCLTVDEARDWDSSSKENDSFVFSMHAIFQTSNMVLLYVQKG